MLVGEEAHDQWMSGTLDEAFELARAYRADGMKIVASGDKKDDFAAAA